MSGPGPARISFLIDLWASAVASWTGEERGAYWSLCVYQAQYGAVPDDLEHMARIAAVPIDRFRELWARLLAAKFERVGGGWQNARMHSERERALDTRRSQKKKADDRWNAGADATALPGHMPGQSRSTCRGSTSSPTSSSSSSPTTTPTATEAPSVPRARKRAQAVDPKALLFELYPALVERLGAAVDRYAEHRKALHKPLTLAGWKAQLKRAAEDPDLWEAAVDQSIEAGFPALRFDLVRARQNGHQRTFDPEPTGIGAVRAFVAKQQQRGTF